MNIIFPYSYSCVCLNLPLTFIFSSLVFNEYRVGIDHLHISIFVHLLSSPTLSSSFSLLSFLLSYFSSSTLYSNLSFMFPENSNCSCDIVSILSSLCPITSIFSVQCVAQLSSNMIINIYIGGLLLKPLNL